MPKVISNQTKPFNISSSEVRRKQVKGLIRKILMIRKSLVKIGYQIYQLN